MLLHRIRKGWERIKGKVRLLMLLHRIRKEWERSKGKAGCRSLINNETEGEKLLLGLNSGKKEGASVRV